MRTNAGNKRNSVCLVKPQAIKNFAKRFRLIGDKEWSVRWRAMPAAARMSSRVADPSSAALAQAWLSPIATVVLVGMDP